MSLSEEMWRYGKLTGESAEHIPIIQLGAYLDGVDKGIEELEKIKGEIKELAFLLDDLSPDKEFVIDLDNIEEVIDNHISELKGENK